MIITGFMSIIRSTVKKKLPPKLQYYLFLHFLFAIMYYQNVVMVTIAITGLIPCNFQNYYLSYFQKIYTLCGLLLFLDEVYVNEGELVTKVKIVKKSNTSSKKSKNFGFANFLESSFWNSQ